MPHLDMDSRWGIYFFTLLSAILAIVKPTILLDVDGVLNPCNTSAALEAWADDWLWVDKGSLMAFKVRRQVWQAVSQWLADGVSVVWCSTWCQSAYAEHLIEILTGLGFSNAAHIPCPPDFLYSSDVDEWKSSVAQYYAERGPVVWIDDEHEFGALRVPCSAHSALRVAPDTYFGLSDVELSQVQDFISRY